MNVTTDDLRGMLRTISKRINDHAEELNALDSQIGDGDHGTGIAAGFAAVVDASEAVETPSDLLRIAASTLMNRMGGSSGALYGVMFLRAALYVRDNEPLTAVVFGDMWQAGMSGVMQRGKSQPGDKTMLDALSPAVDALRQQMAENATLGEALAAAARAAELGAQATAKMAAKHGRARYVGERSIGHVDAGARSIALMFEAMRDYWRAERNGEA